MRSAMLLTVLLGCGWAASGATMLSLSPGDAPPCLTVPEEVVSIDLCVVAPMDSAGLTIESPTEFALDTESEPVVDKPWIQGPEPPAALLAAGGFACIALLHYRRRLSESIHRSRRRVYTIRRMA